MSTPDELSPTPDEKTRHQEGKQERGREDGQQTRPRQKEQKKLLRARGKRPKVHASEGQPGLETLNNYEKKGRGTQEAQQC